MRPSADYAVTGIIEMRKARALRKDTVFHLRRIADNGVCADVNGASYICAVTYFRAAFYNAWRDYFRAFRNFRRAVYPYVLLWRIIVVAEGTTEGDYIFREFFRRLPGKFIFRNERVRTVKQRPRGYIHHILPLFL